MSASEPSPLDGIPALPDVHSDDQSDSPCTPRTAAFNPYADVMEVALAHDDRHFFAYFKSVKSMAYTTSGPVGAGNSSLLYIQINLDVDNNQTTGYLSTQVCSE